MARVGLAYSHEESHQPNRGDWPRGPITTTHQHGSVPYWLLVAAPASWPPLRLARRAARGWVGSRRRRAGRCAGCAYDLRGITGRCPECGTERDTNARVGPLFTRITPRRTHATTTDGR